MTEEVTYPLPTVHLNGTGKKMLLEGNVNILGKINEVKEAIQACEFHGRDYYVQDNDPAMDAFNDDNAFSRAYNERQKHLQALADMERYFMDHVEHLIEQ
tara:strand:- start:548 stop:847 length:300 start_codon:yes stop_codon:yes gene_type:complete